MFIVVTLTAVIWLTQSMRFIKFILNRGLALETFLELTVLLLPSFLLVTIPIALFLSTMFAFNKMLNDRELVVMRGTGFSDMTLAKPIIGFGVLCVLIGYFISLYLMPVSFRQFRTLQNEVRNNFSAGLIQEGMFNAMGKITIYVRARDGERISGILVQDNRNPTKPVTMMAEYGIITKGPNGPRVLMANGNRQELDRQTGKVSLLFFKQYSFEFGGTKSKGEVWRQPNERFLGQLLYPGNDKGDRYYRKKLIAEGHNRLIAPLYSLVLPLIALVTMLSGQFNKRGQIKRILIGLTAAAAVEGGRSRAIQCLREYAGINPARLRKCDTSDLHLSLFVVASA